jgi:hypothetical protein
LFAKSWNTPIPSAPAAMVPTSDKRGFSGSAGFGGGGGGAEAN